MKNIAFRKHDHKRCVSRALAGAEALCARKGSRFTPLRRRVLEILWRSHDPIGAYELLDRLKGEGRRAAPPTVYRALQFLSDAGLIHRIESLNAYVGCPNPETRHDAQHLICGTCGGVAEIEVAGITAAITAEAGVLDFTVSRQTVEIIGFCARCRGP